MTHYCNCNQLDTVRLRKIPPAHPAHFGLDPFKKEKIVVLEEIHLVFNPFIFIRNKNASDGFSALE
jgi:hypothetical protein